MRHTTVLAGVCGTDPFRLMESFLRELREMGLRRSSELSDGRVIDGMFRLNLEETGMAFSAEIDMIARVRTNRVQAYPMCSTSSRRGKWRARAPSCWWSTWHRKARLARRQSAVTGVPAGAFRSAHHRRRRGDAGTFWCSVTARPISQAEGCGMDRWPHARSWMGIFGASWIRAACRRGRGRRADSQLRRTRHAGEQATMGSADGTGGNAARQG